MLIGGIEAGGTKIVCGAAEVTEEGIHILDRMRFATWRPEEAVRKAADYFKDFPIKALGVACFGPLDLRKDSATYGHIRATPKKGWEHFDLLGPFEKEIGVPAVLDTDVNGAALGEGAYGAGKGKSVVAYITVGTGIGVGLSIGGKPLHGLVHPEGGHMPVVRAPGDTYEGCCTFHRDSFLPAGCLEGYAAGPAIEKRWGEKGENLGSRSEVWEMEAFYLSQGVSQIALLCSPDIIILGGGVMHQASLFPMVRERVKDQMHGYVHAPILDGDISDYIVPPALGDDAGLAGACRMGYDWLKS